MLKILTKPRAKNDIKKIWRYTYDKYGEKQADDYTNQLGQAINAMVVNPMLGIAIDYVKKGYRQYHFKHHLVIYRLTQKSIEVVRILGENMDASRHL